ncbi:MAG: NAD-dependent epimerase/dehydratase family protein [Planctomycetes bacterium]|nr:NAD-dependent epimerase/dehydratase family protein [Planctomycetota bacterium]MCB9887657.1 NAD-dependent epimerase/dehydratase family protein [Planctomycetota bacterium]
MPLATNSTLLLTGATGFLGGALAKALLDSGFAPARLRLLVRDPARAERMGLPGEALCRGDLGDPDGAASLARAVEGVDVAVHLAGSLKAFGSQGYEAVNVDGTRRLYAAMRDVAPHAFVVHVSSLAAAGPSVDGGGSAASPDRCRPISAYGSSKLRGEMELLRAGLAHTILRPPVVYGPGDGATRLLFQQATAPLVVVPRRAAPISVIHADDVVAALLAAIERRVAGAVLPLDGPERTDTHAFSRAIAEACGRRARLVPVPIALAACAAVASDLVARLRRRPSYFNRDKVREIGAPGWVADGEPVRAALGFAPRIGLSEGLAAVARAEGFARRVTSATA